MHWRKVAAKCQQGRLQRKVIFKMLLYHSMYTALVCKTFMWDHFQELNFYYYGIIYMDFRVEVKLFSLASNIAALVNKCVYRNDWEEIKLKEQNKKMGQDGWGQKRTSLQTFVHRVLIGLYQGSLLLFCSTQKIIIFNHLITFSTFRPQHIWWDRVL